MSRGGGRGVSMKNEDYRPFSDMVGGGNRGRGRFTRPRARISRGAGGRGRGFEGKEREPPQHPDRPDSHGDERRYSERRDERDERPYLEDDRERGYQRGRGRGFRPHDRGQKYARGYVRGGPPDNQWRGMSRGRGYHGNYRGKVPKDQYYRSRERSRSRSFERRSHSGSRERSRDKRSRSRSYDRRSYSRSRDRSHSHSRSRDRSRSHSRYRDRSRSRSRRSSYSRSFTGSRSYDSVTSHTSSDRSHSRSPSHEKSKSNSKIVENRTVSGLQEKSKQQSSSRERKVVSSSPKSANSGLYSPKVASLKPDESIRIVVDNPNYQASTKEPKQHNFKNDSRSGSENSERKVARDFDMFDFDEQNKKRPSTLSANRIAEMEMQLAKYNENPTKNSDKMTRKQTRPSEEPLISTPGEEYERLIMQSRKAPDVAVEEKRDSSNPNFAALETITRLRAAESLVTNLKANIVYEGKHTPSPTTDNRNIKSILKRSTESSDADMFVSKSQGQMSSEKNSVLDAIASIDHIEDEDEFLYGSNDSEKVAKKEVSVPMMETRSQALHQQHADPYRWENRKPAQPEKQEQRQEMQTNLASVTSQASDLLGGDILSALQGHHPMPVTESSQSSYNRGGNTSISTSFEDKKKERLQYLLSHLQRENLTKDQILHLSEVVKQVQQQEEPPSSQMYSGGVLASQSVGQQSGYTQDPKSHVGTNSSTGFSSTITSILSRDLLGNVQHDAPQKPTETRPEMSEPPQDTTIQNILKSIGFNFELSKLTQEKAKKTKEQEEKETMDQYGLLQASSFLQTGIQNIDVNKTVVKENQAESKPAKVKETRKSKVFEVSESYEERARRYREEQMKKQQAFIAPPKVAPVQHVPTSSPGPNPTALGAITSYGGYRGYAEGDQYGNTQQGYEQPFQDPYTSLEQYDDYEMRQFKYMEHQQEQENQYHAPIQQQSVSEEDRISTLKVIETKVETKENETFQRHKHPSSRESKYIWEWDGEQEKRSRSPEEDIKGSDESRKVPVSGGSQYRRRDGSVGSPRERPSKRTVLLPKTSQSKQKHEEDDTMSKDIVSENSASRKTLHRTISESSDGVKTSNKINDLERLRLAREMEERKKRLHALEKEMDRLRKQQNELMRKRQRMKDGHKDPLIVENSKLQDEIAQQISILRAASEEGIRVLPAEKDLKKIPKPIYKRPSSPGPELSAHQELDDVKIEVNIKDAKVEERKVKVNSPKFNYQFFDPGNHWCQLCSHLSSNVFEVFQHLQTIKHQQQMDPYNRPWMSLSTQPQADPKGQSVVAPIKGAEFLMFAKAYFCSLCKVFSGDVACAEDHLKTVEHNDKYKQYLEENPFYERRLKLDKAAGMLNASKEEIPEKKVEKSVAEVKKAEVEKKKKTKKAKKETEKVEKKKVEKKRYRSHDADDYVSDEDRYKRRRGSPVSQERDRSHRSYGEDEDYRRSSKDYGCKWNDYDDSHDKNPKWKRRSPSAEQELDDDKKAGNRQSISIKLSSGKHFLPTKAKEAAPNPLDLVYERIAKINKVILKSETPTFLKRKIPQKSKLLFPVLPKKAPETLMKDEQPMPLGKFLSLPGSSQTTQDMVPVVSKPIAVEVAKVSKSTPLLTTATQQAFSKPPLPPGPPPKQIDPNEAEEFRLLGIDPLPESDVKPTPPPSLAPTDAKPSSSMATSTASGLYSVFFGKSSLGPQVNKNVALSVGRSNAAGGAECMNLEKTKTVSSQNSDAGDSSAGVLADLKESKKELDIITSASNVDNDDAASEGSGVSMGSDFEILDECDAS